MKNMKIKTLLVISFLEMAFLTFFTGLVGNKVISSYTELTDSYISFASGLMMVVTILSVVLAIVNIFILRSVFVKPITEITDAAKKVAEGDVHVELNHDGNNEIGELCKDLNEMIDKIKYQALLAEDISRGNLQVDVKVKSAEDVLGKALGELVENNNRVLTNIKESTMQVSTGADQVASASQALAQGATEQASAIEQITASMDEIAEKTNANATQTNTVEQLAHNVKNEAENGQEKMTKMIEAMKDINLSSENISKIIKVIDDIAFQTNILALNATVEAARAGAHGKGFAVVAEEVRNLAEKSAQAASETGELISDSIHKVNHGSELAEDTSKALEGIATDVAKTVELIDSIAVATSSQATAVSQVNQAIAQVSQVVQTNSATSEECAASSEELANQSAALIELLGKYKLKEGQYTMASTMSGKPSFTKSRAPIDNESIISLEGDFGKY